MIHSIQIGDNVAYTRDNKSSIGLVLSVGTTFASIAFNPGMSPDAAERIAIKHLTKINEKLIQNQRPNNSSLCVVLPGQVHISTLPKLTKTRSQAIARHLRKAHAENA